MQRSKINKSYQHSQRNKTQESEYVRYRADCNGLPYQEVPNNDCFISAVITSYSSDDYKSDTVSSIIEDEKKLRDFSCRVATELASMTEPPSYGSIVEPLKDGFSFCNHIAKRLVLLRKAGKLVRKRPIFQKARTGARKKKVEGVISGTQIRKVE